MKKGRYQFWMIVCDDPAVVAAQGDTTGEGWHALISFHKPRVIHGTKKKAEQVAAKAAAKYGKPFYILEAVSVAEPITPTVELFDLV